MPSSIFGGGTGLGSGFVGSSTESDISMGEVSTAGWVFVAPKR